MYNEYIVNLKQLNRKGESSRRNAKHMENNLWNFDLLKYVYAIRATSVNRKIESEKEKCGIVYICYPIRIVSFISKETVLEGISLMNANALKPKLYRALF